MHQRRPTRRMLHDVIILVHFEFLHKNYKKILMLLFSYICFPRKGTLTDAGDGDGGGETQKLIQKTFRNTIVHTSRHVSEMYRTF